MARLIVPIKNPSPPKPPVLSLVSACAAVNPWTDDTDGRWTGGFAYAPENRYAGEIRDPCDYVTDDVPALPAPVLIVADLVDTGTGGTLAANTAYAYVATFVNANGQTTGSTEQAITTGGGAGTHTVTITAPLPDGSSEEGITVDVYGRIHGSLGLIAQGIVPTGSESAGYTWTWIDTGAAAPAAAVPSSNTTAGPGNYVNAAVVTYYPWLVVVEDACSSWGFEERDFKGRATRLLESATPEAIGSEFSTGLKAQAASYPNNYLQNSGSVVDLTPGGGPPSIARGTQILEDYIANTGFGGQCALHVQPQTAPNLLGARRVGDLLLTVLDNVVIPDPGYNGNGPGNAVPAAGTAWIYATDMPTVRIDSEIKVFPDTFAEALDRGQNGEPNLIRFRAERYVSATFDATVHAGIRVTLAV